MTARRVLGLILCAAMLAACDVVSAVPFLATPTPPPPPPRTPAPTPTPSPTPTPKPVLEVELVHTSLNEKAGPLFVTVAFRLRNPSATEWLLQATAEGALFTPDGRRLPLAKPIVAFDLGPGEQKWFAFPAVDTFGSIIGKVTISYTGGQWLPAALYPYPGGVPISGARAAVQPRTLLPQTADYVVTNSGQLGITGIVRAFSFDAENTFLGILECPNRLYLAGAEATVTCAASHPAALGGARVLFTAYPDLRPVLVLPTPSPRPSPTP